MKLGTKSFLIYFGVSIPILIGIVWLLNSALRSEFEEDELEKVRIEQRQLTITLEGENLNQKHVISTDGLSKVEPITQLPQNKTQVHDTLIFDSAEKELLPYKIYISFHQIGNQYVKLTIAKDQNGTEEMVENLTASITIVLGIMVLIFFGVNFYISKVVWRPFFKTMKQLKNYSVNKHQDNLFEHSSIVEFNQLNMELNEMTKAVYNVYLEQKEFTENASHELQTPLAVIQTNLDLLMQSENLGKNEMERIERIETSTVKLKNLNRALLLLTKIDNQQFSLRKHVNINELVIRILNQLQDQITAKQLLVFTNNDSETSIMIDPTLAEILVSNLLQNAIRHNYQNGSIEVTITKEKLILKNTGEPLSFPSHEIFDRFKKKDTAQESIGLGLSIVKRIIESEGMQIDYSMVESQHIFELSFSGKMI